MRPPIEDLIVRAPSQDDHLEIVRLIDGWFERQVQRDLPRLWFRHFSSTSRIAREPGGRRPIGFAVAYLGTDDRAMGVLHLVGVDPARRRRGVGAALLEALVQELRAREARQVETTCPPDEPGAMAFLRAVGFTVADGEGASPLYGTPAHADWNREGDDQVVLRRPL
jgi:GNAT superfamily N-acetyltransferase